MLSADRPDNVTRGRLPRKGRDPTQNSNGITLTAKTPKKKATPEKEKDNHRLIAENRRAHREYEVIDTLECGIVLVGSEVKSLRKGQLSLDEAYGRVKEGEVWLINCDIPEYVQANQFNHVSKRPRKLLMHRREIKRFALLAFEKGLTLVPLKMYFTEGRAKILMGICKGASFSTNAKCSRRRACNGISIGRCAGGSCENGSDQMSYNAMVFNVMIASPSDVATERQNIREIIHSWNAMNSQDRHLVLLPSGWESHSSPLMGNRAQAIINEQVLQQCDLLVAVFWTRLGSPTGEALSGTVEEINKHVGANKPAMIYFSNAPVRPDSVDENQYRALRDFRDDCAKRGLIESYSSIEEFRDKFTRQLTQTILRVFKDLAPISEHDLQEIARQADVPQLSPEAQQLVLECSQDQSGTVLRVRVMGGMIVQTNGQQFAEMGDPRSEAKWKAAIDELVVMGFLEPRGYKGEVFGITNEGYEVADRLRNRG